MNNDLVFKLDLIDQRYTLPKYFGVSSRMVTYWKSKVVLPFFDTGKKGKMNVPQALWVCLIQELSTFGINTTKLAELAKMVWDEPREKGYFKSKLEKHMCIPLMPFIEQIVSVEFQRVKKDIAYLSQIENQIREIIMFKSPKYIELLVDNDNIKPLIIREDHKKAKQLADFFLNNKLPKTARLLIEPRAQDNYKLTILTK